MKRLINVFTMLCLLAVTGANAQKLTIDKVQKAYLRNSGAIVEKGLVKGYFIFIQSDKVDRKTNEYTLQLTDQNLNKIKDIVFTDSKDVELLEASYNGSSLAFFFHNRKDKTTELRIYDINGKQKFSYTKQLDKKTERLWDMYRMTGKPSGDDDDDNGGNTYLYDIADQGFATVLPHREDKNKTYEINFYGADTKKEWAYTPADEERWASPTYLGATDSLLILQVYKKQAQLKGEPVSTVLGLNFHTKKVQYEIESHADTYTFLPMNFVKLKNNNVLLMGSYYDKDANISKDYSNGMAAYEIDNKGKIVTKKYNTWAGDFGRYLNVSEKGKLEDIGYLYIHKIIQTPAGKFFAVAEGYKRNANAWGIAANVLAGGRTNAGVTKIMVTDMVVMEFDKDYKVKGAVAYDKKDNTVIGSNMSDYNSQHALAVMIKNTGGFDYAFTTRMPGDEEFSFCYNDYEKSKDYKGQTFNTISYDGKKLKTDKIQLSSSATRMAIFQAKPGYVMISEYFKKKKTIEMRLEKLNY